VADLSAMLIILYMCLVSSHSSCFVLMTVMTLSVDSGIGGIDIDDNRAYLECHVISSAVRYARKGASHY